MNANKKNIKCMVYIKIHAKLTKMYENAEKCPKVGNICEGLKSRDKM